MTSRATVLGTPGRELTTVARRVTWLRVRKMRFEILLVGLSVTVIIVAFGLVPGVTLFPAYARGVIAGLAASLLPSGLLWHAVLTDASMTWRVGALGEYWTSDELRLLGPDWTLLNNLRIPGADGSLREIDHVLVGPGGVHVIDSKFWPSKARRLDASASPDINSAALGAMRQAALVRLALAEVVPPESVNGNVIFWGGDLLSPGELVLTNRRGIRIFHGRDAGAWRNAIASQPCLGPSEVKSAIERLQTYLVPEQRFRNAKPPADWVRPTSGT